MKAGWAPLAAAALAALLVFLTSHSALASAVALAVTFGSVALARRATTSRLPAVARPSLVTGPLELPMLRAVMHGMSEGVWVTSAQGTITEHNPALKELLSVPGAVVGKTPIELIRNAGLQDAVSDACRQGLGARLELDLDGAVARVLAVQVFALAPLPGSAAVFFDVTELKRLEKVRKDFVANVSHELRTPITAILGYAETLRSGAIADATAAPKMVEIIHRQSQRLSALVEDLLELSRLENRQTQLAKVAVDLAVVVGRALDVVRPKATAKEIELRNQVPALSVRGDEAAIEQVLLNLLDNALKYTPERGCVTLSVRLDAKKARIEINDTGVGIEAKHLGRIFERFYRVDTGRSRDHGGSGLGLSIVKHLVTTMEGDVGVESQPGAGSTFFVVLPCA